MIRNDELARSIETDYRRATVSDRVRAMLEYAVKLTIDPSAMGPGDIAVLHEAGLGDEEILDVCQVTSYYNFVNRMAQGLGVELEPYWEDAS